jgi:hypothetical protein
VPFVRVLRDKRGYESTYLIHWFRDAQPPRSSILYVFRTPGGTSAGLNALELGRRQEIEEAYPEIDFQWKALVKNQQVVEVAPELKWLTKRRRTKAATPESDTKPAVPSALEGKNQEAQLAFLAEWHPRFRERALKHTTEQVRQEALLALAERLNPAAWTDADEISEGLTKASDALERLSKVFAKPRRSSRGARKSRVRPRDSAAPSGVAPAGASTGSGEQAPDTTPETGEFS